MWQDNPTVLQMNEMIPLKDVIERGPDISNFRNEWDKTQVAKFVSQWSRSFEILKMLQMYIGIEP